MGASLDVVELLTNDHRTLGAMARQLDTTEQPAAARELFVQLVQMVAAHEAAEQKVVFPAFRAALPDVETEAIARLGEHEEINELIAEMQTLTPSGLAFAKRASALALDLQRHFEHEEEELFPRLRATLSKERLTELAAEAKAAEANAPAFPAAPEPHH